MSIETAKLDDYAFRLGSHELKPLMLGGMGVNISTKALALEVARLGGVGHLSDAMLPDVDDRELGTHFTAEKAKRFRTMAGLDPKPDMHFRLEDVERAARLYVEDVMKEKRGSGLVFLNCMEKLTMNDARGTLKSRLNAALDAGIDGISLSAGLHTSSFSLMEENPRFRDAYLGIVVSSVRALKIFLRRSSKTNRLPDYVVVEGPLAGGHLGFGMDDWMNFDLAQITREVFTISRESGLPSAVKQAYFRAEADDIEVNGVSPTGYPMRMLKSSPCIAADTKPQCEAYGYMLDRGECPYLKAYREAAAEHPELKRHAIAGKTCLCFQMKSYKVYTCGATAHRLKETSVMLPDGTWYEPPAEHIMNDYLTSTNDRILLPTVPADVLAAHSIPA